MKSKSKAKKSLKFIFRACSAAFIAAPMLLACIVGLGFVVPFSVRTTAEFNAALGAAQTAGISALISEYTAFLSGTAELDFVKETAATQNITSLERATAFIKAYAENGCGVDDILLTDEQGVIFTGCYESYQSAESFFDAANMLSNISSTAVSGFYEHGRFYAAKAIRTDGDVGVPRETVGYLIIIAQPDLLPDFMANTSLKDNSGESAVFDLNGNIISASGSPGKALHNGAATYLNRYNKGQSADRFKQGEHTALTAPLAGTKWTWIAVYPSSFVVTRGLRVFGAAFAIAAAVCLGCAVVAFVYSRMIANPLKSAIQKMKTGERIYKADKSDKGEYGELSRLKRAYNAALDELEFRKRLHQIIEG